MYASREAKIGPSDKNWRSFYDFIKES